MKAHTSEFKNKIKTMGRELDSKITYTLNGVNVELGKEQLNSITPTYQGALLKSVMKELDIDSNVYIPEKTILNYQFGVKVNGEYEYINFGNYVVYKTEKQEDTNSYKLICYDKMLYTMIDYTPLDITYPINLREYINAIATKCGLEFANIVGTFANYDTPINKDNFSNGNYTFRDVLDYVAELVGGWFCINDDDKLEIRYPSQAKNYEGDSGEEINFYTEVEDKIKELTIYGNSIQETRSGKNLFNKSITPIIASGGQTITELDTGVKISCTNSSSSNVVKQAIYKLIDLTNYVGKVVRIKCDFSKSNENLAPRYCIGLCDVNGNNRTQKSVSITSGETISFTVPTLDGTSIYLCVWLYCTYITNINSGDYVDFTNLIVTVDNSDMTYEPYGVSPSPDYPSEIESVGYENLFDKDNTTYKNGYYKGDNGEEISTNYSGYITSYVSVQPNTIYTISGKLKGITNTGAVYFYDNLKNWISRLSNANLNEGEFTFTTPNNCYYMQFQYIMSVYDASTIQITKGTKIYNYIPYGKYGIEVKNNGNNLFDENKYFSMLSNDNGIYTGSSSLPFKTYDSSKGGLGLIFEPNTSYTISFVAKNTSFVGNTFSVAIRYSDDTTKSLIVSTTDWKTYKFVTNETKSISMIYFTYYNNAEFSIKEFIISKTSDYTGYEPYQSNTTSFSLDQPLRSLPNGVKDELVIENGRAKIIKRIGKVVLDGSENWNKIQEATTSTDYYYAYTIGYDKLIGSKYTGISNNFIVKQGTYITASSTVDSDMLGVGGTGNGKIRMFIKKSRLTEMTTTELKSWLSTHNTQVYYELAEPYTEEIGEVEIPSTFKGSNNITLSANINTNIDITYTKEYEEVDREFLKDVNVSFSKKYGPVNSVVFSRGGGSDNIYRKDYDSISANGLTEIKITDNPFLEDDERENFIQSVFDKLNGLEFYIMDVASTGITYLELGDLYYFNMSEDKPSLKAGLVQAGLRKAQGSSLGKYICLMLNDKIDITQGLSESIYVDEPDITETDYKTANITDKSIKNAIIQTNKNSAEILLKVNSDEVVSAINLSPEKIKIQSSKIDVDGVLSVLGKAGSTVINGANITTGSISCDRLKGGTLSGQTIVGGSISITKGEYYFNMGIATDNPSCSGLNVGSKNVRGKGIKAYCDVTATGFAITDSDTGKSQPVNIYDGHGHVHYLTFTGGILTKWEYK